MADRTWEDGGSGSCDVRTLYWDLYQPWIQILVELTEMMQKGLSGFRRFLDVVETEPEIVNAPDAESIG